MVDITSLSQFFSSGEFIFLVEYLAGKALDKIFEQKTEQMTSKEFLSRQLVNALENALRATCKKYCWIYDEHAISSTFSTSGNMWIGINSTEKLINVLGHAIGNEYSNLITEEVARFWVDAFDMEVACSQELYNYMNGKKNISEKGLPLQPQIQSQYPHFITDPPDSAAAFFVGRDEEAEQLYNLIVDQHKKVLLSGVGGLGKTELTKLFLNKLMSKSALESGIEEIAWIPYDNQSICMSVQRALNLQCDPSEVWKILQEKAMEQRSKLLLVIDNVENLEEDEYLKKLATLPSNILVTSRQKELQGFSDVFSLQPLSLESCRTLFYKHFQFDEFDERDNEVLNDIIELTARLTIMIVFIAKVAYLEGMKLHELYGSLVEKGFKLSEEDVSCEHENLQNDDTIIQQMCILFSLVKYSDSAKAILTNISIIPNLQFEFRHAKKWFRISKNSYLLKLNKMGMLEHVVKNRKHFYWMHSVIAAAIREQQKEHLYALSRPFVDILSEELNTGPVLGKEYEKAYLIPFSWSIADIMENHWYIEDDTDFLSNLFHICFACSNYSLCEKIIDIIIRIQKNNPTFTAVDLAYSYRNKIDLLNQFDKVDEAKPIFSEVERLMATTDLPDDERNILSYQYGLYYQIRGDYHESKKHFQHCIDCAERQPSDTREKDISTAYANMARMLVEAGEFFEAYKHIKKAITAERVDEFDSDQIVCYSTLAGICTELMNAGYGTTYIDEAISAFKKVIAFREKHLGKHHADTAVIYHDYAYFLYICGDYDMALKYNEKACCIQEELFAEHSITRMRGLNTKAMIIWEQGKHDEACSIYEYIIKTTEQMGNNYLVDLFHFLLSYGRCLHEIDNDNLSKEYYARCIKLWTRMSDAGTRILCQAYQEYGEILFSEGNTIEAAKNFENAIKCNNEDWYLNVDLVDSLAACMLLNNQIPESLQEFARLLQILTKQNVSDAETKYTLCNNLACVLDAKTEEEFDYREALLNLVESDTDVLAYTLHYLDDLLQDTALEENSAEIDHEES